MSNEIRVLLSALDPHRRDLCAAVLALCAPEFEAPAPPTQVFLSSLYQKLCGRMFPDGLPEIPALTADEEGYLAALESALQNPADSFDPVSYTHLAKLLFACKGEIYSPRPAQQTPAAFG